MAEPILVRAAAPFGEVLFGDGSAGEEPVEGGLGVRQFVDPLEQGRAEFAVEQTEVELFASFVTETGDFADPGYHKKFESLRV